MKFLSELWNHKLINRDILFSASILCADLLQDEPATEINGIVYICDFQGLSLSQALQLTPYIAKRTLDYVQGSIPQRIKGFHIVNQPRILEPIFLALKPFFKEKFRKRIMMHGSNYSLLHQDIAPEYLPECYGGTIKGDMMYGLETYELASHYTEHFESLQKYGFKKS